MASLQVVQAVERRLTENFDSAPFLVENDGEGVPVGHGLSLIHI
mgnify:CR=1 FL=1